MYRKWYICIVVILCLFVAIVIIKNYVYSPQSGLQVLQNDNRRTTGNKKQDLNKPAAIEVITVRGEQHIQLDGIVEAVSSNADVNDNVVSLSLKDSNYLKINLHLGSMTYHIFVRRYESPPRRYTGKVMATQDLLPYLSKDKEVQVELGLPKDKNDEDIIKRVMDYSRRQPSQSSLIDVPKHLIVRLSIL